jgi:hypothetical protein
MDDREDGGTWMGKSLWNLAFRSKGSGFPLGKHLLSHLKRAYVVLGLCLVLHGHALAFDGSNLGEPLNLFQPTADTFDWGSQVNWNFSAIRSSMNAVAVTTGSLTTQIQALATTYVNVSGDSMTGQLTLAASTLTVTGADANGRSAAFSYGVSVGSITASSATLTATGDTQYSLSTSSGINVSAGGVTATFFQGALAGNAATATALAANPSDCAAGNFANAIAASGSLTCSADGSSLTNLTAANISAGTLGASVIASSVAATGVGSGTCGDATTSCRIDYGVDGRIARVSSTTITSSGASTSSTNTWSGGNYFVGSSTIGVSGTDLSKAWSSYTPTYTGFTGGSEPTGQTCNWVRIGKLVHVSCSAVSALGTSNSTSMGMSLPAAAGRSYDVVAAADVFDSGSRVSDTTYLRFTSASAEMALFKNGAGASFTNSGTKGVQTFTFFYEAQ